MAETSDFEVVLEEEPFKSGEIENIDEQGLLVGLEVETETRNDFNMALEYENREDNVEHVDIQSEIFEGDHLTGKGFEDDNIMGKVFDTVDDAYAFYNRYALLHGFGIRIYSTYKNKITKEHYRKIYVCSKQGFKNLTSKSSEVSTKRRRDLRTGCEAMFRISKRKDGKWFVDIFSDAHNHELTLTPTKVVKHRSHGKFHRSIICKSIMSELGQSGLRPCQIKKVVNAMKSPFENDVTSKQCADVLAQERKQYRGKEFYGVIKYFQDKLIEDRDLYFIVDLDEDGFPRNLFWADGRSRDSYIKFGDVVVFDVTYMTNRFKMPFAPFVGVNHHGQSIIFGGALLENEKQETFEWLFKNFLECMFDNIGLEDTYNEEGVSALQLWCLQSKFTKAIEQAKNSPLEIKKLHTMLGQFLEQQMDRNKSTEFESASKDSHAQTSQVNMMPQLSVRDPQVLTKTKGRPKKANRIKHPMEVPKKRTCSYCKKLGHYINGCKRKKEDDALGEKEA